MKNITDEQLKLISPDTDKMYMFKVKDYTTMLLGRKCKGNKDVEQFYYVQRGDGETYAYDWYRLEGRIELKTIV